MIFNPPLYHGTDARIVRLPLEQRVGLAKYCKFLAETLYKVYSDLESKDKNFNVLKDTLSEINHLDYFKHISDAFSTLKCAHVSEYFEYEHLYLTRNKVEALLYASKSRYFGEIGYSTYWLRYGIELLLHTKFYIRNELQSFHTLFDDLAIGKPEPIIIEFSELDSDLLRGEAGEHIYDFNNLGNRDLRYLGNIDLSNKQLIPANQWAEKNKCVEIFDKVQKFYGN
jgi:hypothetical protein